ncbi:MAG: rhodanese-like domain-containing protein [Desulfobacterales bacterium]
MKKNHFIRFVIIAVLLLASVWWSMATVATEIAEAQHYPNKEILVSTQWLKSHMNDPNLIIVDVRDDKYFDGKLIPGAIRFIWSDFRYSDHSRKIGDLFIGVTQAQKILGNAGISRPDTLVLYDSVARDGGATASYVFWVLELLGHKKIKILERGIDDWVESGNDVVMEPRKMEPVLYQALAEETKLRKTADGHFVYNRLGDPHYQIIDVRSRKEYIGEIANEALGGGPLKLGHIPTAVNIDYRDNWLDAESKNIKPYDQLQKLYRGLDSSRAVILYCHSARRSSFSYFILRLMGFSDVILYEPSWYEWGQLSGFFPVELTEHELAGGDLPGASKSVETTKTQTPREKTEASKDGYVSCGG